MKNTLAIKIYIIALAILALLTSNMYLPALPILQHSFHTTVHASQLTISLYMLGLALGMLFYGPLSDSYGRKKIISLGLVIYIVGVIMSVFSHSITTFMLSRAIQAFGAASVLSLWQALAIDFFKKNALKMIATGYIAIGFIPAVSPVIGGYMTIHFGWKSIFVLLAAYSVLALLATVFLLKNKSIDRVGISFKKITHDYKSLFRSKRFISLMLFSSLLYSMLYMFMAQAPNILHSLHYSTKAISFFFLPISVAFILGGIITRNFFQDNKNRLAYLGIAFYTIGALTQLMFSLLGFDNHWQALITPVTVMTIGAGILMPLAVSKAMTLHAEMAGSSASMLGFTQNMMAFILSSLGAALSIYGAFGLTLSLVMVAVIVLVVGTYIGKKHFFEGS